MPRKQKFVYFCFDCHQCFPRSTLLSQHCSDTGHSPPTCLPSLLQCTFEKCHRTFTCREALRQHLDSSSHKNESLQPSQPPQPQFQSSQVQLSHSPPSQLQLLQPLQSEIFKMQILKLLLSQSQLLQSQILDLQISQLRLSQLQQWESDSRRFEKSIVEVNGFTKSTPVITAQDVKGITSHSYSTNLSCPAPQTVDPRWSLISQSQRPAILQSLASRCHPEDLLAKNNYFETALYRVARESPYPNPALPKRAVVALDCEMVGVAYEYGSSEIARVSAIDFLTGEILMDRLVQPMKPVTDWKTEFSGITAAMMDVAVTTNVALKGWPAARAELWKYVDAHTILVGHALNHDLSGLGIIHRLVVDSAILIKGPAKNMKWGLKTLCSELLTMDIRRGIVGHDSVEDTFAAREVVLWCINNEGRLKIWEQKKKDERFKAQANRERARNAGRKPSGYNLTEEWNWSLGYNGYNQD